MKILGILAVAALGFINSKVFANCHQTLGSDVKALTNEHVKIAVVEVIASRVTKTEYSSDGIGWERWEGKIDLKVVEHLFGEPPTEKELTVPFRSTTEPIENWGAWLCGRGDPKGRYFIMAWNDVGPCGLHNVVLFPSDKRILLLPFEISDPKSKVVTVLKELLQLLRDKASKDAVEKKMKELQEAAAIKTSP